jgi:CheY-like chemotaxis protein
MSHDVKQILVAEDNPALLEIMRFTLEQAGFQVTTAVNGREASELLDAQCYDLIITDHQMPELSGWDLCVRMREDTTHAHTPVIFLTAKSLELGAARLKDELGVVATFAKPFSPRELICTVKECLAPAREEPIDG